MKPQSKLNFSRQVALPSHLAIGSNVAHIVANAIGRVNRAVERVEEICPEFKVPNLAEVGAFDDADVFVEIGEPSRIGIVPSGVAKGKRRWNCKRIGVEVEVGSRIEFP